MKRFEVEHAGQIVTKEGGFLPAEVIDALTDQILDEIFALPDAEDPDVTATLTTGVVHIRLWIEAMSPSDALERAGAIIRSALHAAGIFTPDWEALSNKELMDSEEVDWQEADWRVTTGKQLLDA